MKQEEAASLVLERLRLISKKRFPLRQKKTKIHPKFQMISATTQIMSYYDVAMIKLAKKIPDGYHPVKLLKPGVSLAAGTKVRLAGFGVTETGSAGTLKTAETTINAQKGRVIVAGGSEKNDGNCFGDSGGPLYVNMGNEWQNAGIVSQSPPSISECGYGTYYASVSANYDDILTMAKQLTGRVNPLEEANSSLVSSDMFLNLKSEVGSDSYIIQVASSLAISSIVLCENEAGGQCQPNQEQAISLNPVKTDENRRLFQTSRAIKLADGKIISAIGLDQNQKRTSLVTIKIVKD